MYKTQKKLALLVMGSLLAFGCASVPKSTAKRDALKSEASQALSEMKARDPNLSAVLENAAGYVVFPDVARGGFIVGGAGGEGVLYERGRPTGFAELSQAAVGAIAGGQKFSELIVLKDDNALDRVKAGKFDVSGQASAVALRAGASAQTQFRDGVAVFVHTKGGAMLDVSVAGQQVKVKM